MKRGETGVWESSAAAGETFQAFVPYTLPPSPPVAMSAVLQEKWDMAHVALGRLDSIATLLPDRDLFLYSYVRQEAVLSSQIEGTQSSLADLLIYENHALPGAPLDDVQEVSCYVSALYLGIERVRDGWPIATPILLELHRTLLHHGRGAACAPGEFRRTQNWLGGRSPSTAVFVPPPPHRVLDCWSNLEKFINNVPQRTAPLLRTALAHVQFETIHPFLDDNGRLGRLLIPLMLMKDELLSESLLYLSLYFKLHRGTYYELLQQVRETGDWESWLDFFADAVLHTAARAVSTVQLLHRLVETDSRRVRELGRISGSALPVLLCLARRPICSAAHIQRETKLSLPTVNSSLRALQNAKIVHQLTNAQRGRLFVYRQYLDTLSQIENAV